MPSIHCELCGLYAPTANHTAVFGTQIHHFCCSGCRMVYSMLMEATESPDPEHFKETDLYRRCVAAGVVPASEEDLERMTAAPLEIQVDRLLPDRRHALNLQRTIAGMWCPACAWVIETALLRSAGMIEAVCDFSTDRLRCRYDPVQVSPSDIARVIEKLGYGLEEGEAHGTASTSRRAFIRLAVCAILSMNVMMISWALYSGFFTELSPQDRGFLAWPVFFLATLVFCYGGGALIRRAWSGLRAGAPGMEALIVMGAGSAYVYSIFNMMRGSLHLYFDTAAMLITLLLLGKQLEQHAKERVRRDLTAFLSLQPGKVRLISSTFPDGRFTAIEQLRVGDLFCVGPHEIVPADGRIVDGRAQVDGSAITGEPRPIGVGTGDGLISGSRVLEGRLHVKAERIGEESMLGQMIGVVTESLGRRTALESRTDRWLAFFVPLLIGMAVITGAAGYLLGLTADETVIRMVTMLVIACPCALGIAIPLARVAGISAAGRQGVLVRDFDAFERAEHIDTLVFDKTGTLTHGRWTLEQVIAQEDLGEAEALALAAGLESQSDHTVARTLRDAAERRGIQPAEVEDVQVHADGVSGRWKGRPLRLGRFLFACPQGAEKTIELPHRVSHPLSYVFLSIQGKACAAFGFGDTIRPGMAKLMGELRQAGFELHLVSGDMEETVLEVARTLGIEHAHAALLPVPKADYIDRLRARGRRVMMMGDGLNDAPALARADLSVAVHTGAPLARGAADVTLMRGDPLQWPVFLSWALRINRGVQQNLWCAAIYNLVGIPLAMAGVLNPLIAVFAMLLSSMTVIGNTLRLVRAAPPEVETLLFNQAKETISASSRM
jgi:heavy metal translocating P-type ATPase